MVGCILLNEFDVSKAVGSDCTVRDVTSILSEVRSHPLGRRKLMRLTTDKFCSSLTV